MITMKEIHKEFQTIFIRKLTDLFCLIIGERESTFIPLRKIYSFKEIQH